MKTTEEERKIINWISNNFTNSSYNNIMVDLTDFNLESAFLCYLCKKTQKDLIAITEGDDEQRDDFCKLFNV